MRPGYVDKTLRFYSKETLGERIKKTREQYGLSLSELGVLANVSASTIYNIESGQDFYVSTLFVICRALDLDVAQLVRQCFND